MVSYSHHMSREALECLGGRPVHGCGRSIGVEGNVGDHSEGMHKVAGLR